MQSTLSHATPLPWHNKASSGSFFRPIVFKGRYRNFTLHWQDLLLLYFYLCIWGIMLIIYPHNLWDPKTHHAVLLIGGIGIWRYGWWLTNFIRSQYYGRIHYPRLRAKADALWKAGWRPSHLHFIMTTFHKYPPTTYRCLEAIIKELNRTDLQATIWIGTGTKKDEEIIHEWASTRNETNLPNIVFIRQNVPGKRAAMGLALRALSRHQVQDSDLAILLDGDSIITPGSLYKCASLLGTLPDIRALTTDEEAICDKPVWMQKWLTMRFAQRRMWMQSHSMSKRVLTLTGRFSVIRARDIVDSSFIRLIEADYLSHWFWGSFRFLSGDDKSSWYYLLSKKSSMLYVPDVLVYTIERIEGNALKRAIDNILRWSGNVLRNGIRAIWLGPRVVPPFIWWCLIDQRIAIWTTLAGFFTAVAIILLVNPNFIFTYILWIMLTRLLMSAALFFYTDRIRMSFTVILYINQLITAFIKTYLLFRLPQQRWANRANQRTNHKLMELRINRIAVLYVNLFYLVLTVLVILLLAGIVQWPDIQQIT